MESTWLSPLVQQQPWNHPITKTERQKRYSQWWKLYNLCKKTSTIIYCATTTFCSWEKKAWKKFRLLSDSNPWPLRYWCSVLTNWANKPTGNRLLNSFILDQWKDDDKVINIWKSLPSPCTEAFQALSVNAFGWCIQDKPPRQSGSVHAWAFFREIKNGYSKYYILQQAMGLWHW